jgi:hypothetical protein
MNLALGQNDRYTRYISAIWEGPLRVTAELIEMVQYAWEIKAEEGFTLIALTVEASQYTYIRDAKNGPEAWKALKDIG